MQPQDQNPETNPIQPVVPPPVAEPVSVPPAEPTPGVVPPPAAAGQVISGGFDQSASILPGSVTEAPKAFVGSFDPLPANQIGQPAPVATAAPAPATPRRRLAKPLLISLVAVLVLGGASAAAYVGIVVPNKPANVLRAALVNSLQEKQSSTSGSIQASSGAIKVNFTTAEDETAKAADINLNITASGINFPIEARLVQQNAYFKIGDLGTISSLLQALNPSAGTVAQSLSQQVSNKWISVDSTLIDQNPTAKCLLAANWTLTPADIKLMQTQYKNHPFTTIQSTSNATVSGKATEKFVLNISDNGLNNFGNSLKGLSLVKAAEKCPGVSNANSSAFRLTANKIDTKTIPITVWVDKATKHIVQVSYSAKDNVEVVDINYKPVSIKAPSNPTPILQFIGTLEKSLSASGVDPSQLLGSSSSSGSSSTSTTTNAKDAERKSDLAALQTQIEAFFAEQGYYPSLDDMNSAAWLSQNLPNLDKASLQDPDGSSQTLVAAPAARAYAYQPADDNGASCESDDSQCSQYKLTATLSDGTTDVKQSLN